MSQQHVFRQESCGSVLTIDIVSDNNPASVVKDCFGICKTFEKRYSRFVAGNWLDQLNAQQDTPMEIDDEAKLLIRELLEFSEKTKGKFDPTITRTLESYGYDKEYSFKRSEAGPIGYKNVSLDGNTLTLTGNVKIEFGAIGKGYLLDVIAKNLLSEGYNHFLLDFGGDMIGYGGYDVGLENPFDLTQLIGTIRVDGFAVASSNGAKRKVGDFHHLLDAHTGKPVIDISGVYISAASAMRADLYSTAVFVSGAEEGKTLLMNTSDISGMIVFSDGSYWMKEGYTGTLFQ